MDIRKVEVTNFKNKTMSQFFETKTEGIVISSIETINITVTGSSSKGDIHTLRSDATIDDNGMITYPPKKYTDRNGSRMLPGEVISIEDAQAKFANASSSISFIS